MLIKCPECGKEISSESKSCPNCGYRMRREKAVSNNYRGLFLFLSGMCFMFSIVMTPAVFVILGVIFLFFFIKCK